MQKQIIGFLGAGNMGQSLIKGLILNGHQANQLWVCDHHLPKLESLSKEYPDLHITQKGNELIEKSDVVVLAVKPQVLQQALTDLKEALSRSKPLLISIAAGISLAQIQRWIAPIQLDIIRAMPNTPALLQTGITGLYADKSISAENQTLAETLFKSVGESAWIEEESLMDVVTALSGSGPAYFFYILESFIASATQLGLPLKTAQKLITHTMLGASKMALHCEDLLTLRQQVTSKGGTTEAGLQALEQGQLPQILAKGLIAATKRGKALNALSNTD